MDKAGNLSETHAVCRDECFQLTGCGDDELVSSCHCRLDRGQSPQSSSLPASLEARSPSADIPAAVGSKVSRGRLPTAEGKGKWHHVSRLVGLGESRSSQSGGVPGPIPASSAALQLGGTLDLSLLISPKRGVRVQMKPPPGYPWTHSRGLKLPELAKEEDGHNPAWFSQAHMRAETDTGMCLLLPAVPMMTHTSV